MPDDEEPTPDWSEKAAAVDGEISEQQVMALYLDMRRSGVGERAAARYLGTSHREIAAYAEAVPAFKLALEDAIHERLERVAEAVYVAGANGDITAAKLVLESHAPAEWTKPTPEMLVKVQRDEPLTLDEVADLHKRLAAAARKETLDAVAIEVQEADDNG
jgi:hypothetical protein